MPPSRKVCSGQQLLIENLWLSLTGQDDTEVTFIPLFELAMGCPCRRQSISGDTSSYLSCLSCQHSFSVVLAV